MCSLLFFSPFFKKLNSLPGVYYWFHNPRIRLPYHANFKNTRYFNIEASQSQLIFPLKIPSKNFLGGPAAKTESSHCREHGLDLWSGNKIATKTKCSQINKHFKKLGFSNISHHH